MHLDITVIPSIVSDLGQALESISIRVNAQVSPMPFEARLLLWPRRSYGR